MAMKKCKECGKEISSNAKTCPNCGAKQGMGCLKIGLIAFGVLVVLGVIGNLLGGGKTGNQTPSTPTANTGGPSATPTPTPAPTPPKPEPEVVQAKIGDEIPVGNFKFKVKGISFKKQVGNQFVKETADGIFLLIDMSITNISKESRTLDNSLFKIKDAEGIVYEFSTRGSTALEMSGSESMFLKQCQPNIPTSGTLIFEVPDKDKTYTLEVSGGVWSGKKADIKLSK